MALSYNGKVRETADAIEDMATRVRDVIVDMRAILAFNSNRAIDWNGDPLPAYIDEDADGNLTGKKFSRTEAANAIAALQALSDAVDGANSFHMGNLNIVADAPK